VSRINAQAFAGTAQRSYRLVISQPNWVLRSVLLTGGAVLIVTLLLIVIPAILIGGVVLVALGLLTAGVGAVRRAIGGGARTPSMREGGRENVRVLRRE